MIAYASRTGTRRNLAALRAADWRLMVSARGVLRTEGFRYALDNGAWTAYQKNEPFDVNAFKKAVALLGADADFVVAPDIVAGGSSSIALSLSWLPQLRLLTKHVLIPVQDGVEPQDVAGVVGANVGLFLGGSTDWKLQTCLMWGECARVWGCWLHVGRVNTVKRIRLCASAGAHSFDGSSASRYCVNVPRLDAARRERVMLGNGVPIQ